MTFQYDSGWIFTFLIRTDVLPFTNLGWIFMTFQCFVIAEKEGLVSLTFLFVNGAIDFKFVVKLRLKSQP